MTLVFLLVLASAVALGLALASLAPQRRARRRLLRLADGTRAPDPMSERAGLFGDDLAPWLVRLFGLFASERSSEALATRDRLRKRLIEAGYRRPSAVSVFLGGRVLLGCSVPLLLALFPGAWRLAELQLAMLLLVASGTGYMFPSFWVDRRRSKRALDIVHGLPDALDLMVVCVQAGLGIIAGLDRVVRDLAPTHPVLAAELELTIYEIRAGKSTVEGLRALADRTGVSDVRALVAVLVQTERFGTNVSDALRVHADALRTRRMQRAEELANKAPLKMLVPTTFIFFATLVVSLGPALVKILTFFAEH